MVQVFVDDEGAVFETWQGDAGKGDSFDDSGLCYLGWVNGDTSYLVTSACDDQNGAWVCKVTDSTETCSACTPDGTCTPCVAGQRACALPGFSDGQ
jgi:hypothetical protein